MAIASTTMAVQRKSSTNAAPCTEKDDYDTTASDSHSKVETEDDESDSSSSLDDTLLFPTERTYCMGLITRKVTHSIIQMH
jgi:hypothetical protein